MAQTTRKAPAKKKPAKGKKPTSKPAAKKPSAAAQKLAAEQLAQHRCILAGFLLLVSFVGFLTLFGVDGFLITAYRRVFYWLFGYGAEILPMALLVTGCILVVRRRKKLRLQISGWLLLPLLFGTVCQLLRKTAAYPVTLSGLGELGMDGCKLLSGGVVSGSLAELLRAALSTVGASVLCCALMVVCVGIGFRLAPEHLGEWLRGLKLPPEPEEEVIPSPVPMKSPSMEKSSRRKPAIDVALDDTPVTRRTPDKNEDKLIPPPNVATPAEALRGMFHREKQTGRAEPRVDAPAPSDSAAAAVAAAAVAAVASPAAEMEGESVLQPVAASAPPSIPVSQREAVPVQPTPPPPDPVPEPEPEEAVPVAQQIESALAAGQKPPIYLYPPLHLLKPGSGKPEGSIQAIQLCAARLVDTLQSFGVEATVIDTTSGPAVTRYELQLQRGIKFSKVVNLADDIALALGASGIRVSTIPDKNAVGIEVPNDRQELVTARDIIGSTAFKNGKSRLSFAVGKDITGQAVVGDIAKMPHMLIAGTTGSGKSVCINSILISLLYKSTPEEVRLIMVDPKMIELGVYNGIPHLLIPVVTDPKKAAGALNWAVSEMMRRYKLFADMGVRDLKGYNAEIERNQDGEGDPLPQIVVVIDELSDLMAIARNEVEEAIIRIAQMARAAGMHLIIATQRPSADVITGLMKTNIPSRIAFAVASAIDSRIILDQMGAEKLLGKGDMLYAPLGGGKPQRVQGCFVSDGEVEEVVAFVKQCGQPEYNQEIIDHIERQAEQETSGEKGSASDRNGADEEDELFDAAVGIIVESGQASVSMLQRRLKLGYSRAARLVDQMEDRGIVGPFEGSKPRAVLISKSDWQERMIRKEEC